MNDLENKHDQEHPPSPSDGNTPTCQEASPAMRITSGETEATDAPTEGAGELSAEGEHNTESEAGFRAENEGDADGERHAASHKDGVVHPGGSGSGFSPSPASVIEPESESDFADSPPGDAASAVTTAVAPGEVRGRLLAQFEQWLDGMLADEFTPPVPVDFIAQALAETADLDPAAAGSDLYGMYAALTGLTGEIRLQGRAFKQLNDALVPVSQLPAGIKDLQDAHRDTGRQIDRLAKMHETASSGASALPSSKETLGVIFDLLERLERGLKTFEGGIASMNANAPHGVLAWLSGAKKRFAVTMKTVQAVHDGQRLTLSRLEESVQQWGIQRVGRIGESFDPKTMTAIDVENNSSQPDGTVVEIYRSGFMLHGQILAVSQVKVAKGK